MEFCEIPREGYIIYGYDKGEEDKKIYIGYSQKSECYKMVERMELAAIFTEEDASKFIESMGARGKLLYKERIDLSSCKIIKEELGEEKNK